MQLVAIDDGFKEDSPEFFPWHLLLVVLGYSFLLFLDKIVGSEHDDEVEELEEDERHKEETCQKENLSLEKAINMNNPILKSIGIALTK